MNLSEKTWINKILSLTKKRDIEGLGKEGFHAITFYNWECGAETNLQGGLGDATISEKEFKKYFKFMHGGDHGRFYVYKRGNIEITLSFNIDNCDTKCGPEKTALNKIFKKRGR